MIQNLSIRCRDIRIFLQKLPKKFKSVKWKWHIRSLVKHSDELRVLLRGGGFSLFAVTETWMKSSTTLRSVSIPGYKKGSKYGSSQCIKIEISWPKVYYGFRGCNLKSEKTIFRRFWVVDSESDIIFYIRVTDQPPKGPETDQVSKLIRNMILKYVKNFIFSCIVQKFLF